jgi:hypothetical protein
MGFEAKIDRNDSVAIAAGVLLHNILSASSKSGKFPFKKSARN